MCCLLNAVWAQHHAQTAPLAKNWIMPVQDRAAVASYVTHEYWRMGSDTILDELSWTVEQSYYFTDHALMSTILNNRHNDYQGQPAHSGSAGPGTTGIKHTTGTI